MEPVTVWEWFWLILLLAIPLVNLIVIIILAIGNGKPSLVNYARAMLVWFLVGFSLAIFIGIISAVLES